MTGLEHLERAKAYAYDADKAAETGEYAAAKSYTRLGGLHAQIAAAEAQAAALYTNTADRMRSFGIDY
jgi:hypothetical protein